MKSQFRIGNLTITEDQLQIVGGNNPFRKIDLADISRIKIYKGTLTKHPVRTSIFGAAFFLIGFVGIFWAQGELTTIPELNHLTMRGVRGFVGMITGIGLILLIGGMSLSLVFLNRVVLKIELHEGGFEIFSLSPIEKSNREKEFIEFLMRKYPATVLQIDSNILNKYLE
ncbi:MAG: hypothetical protein ABJF11_11715 [Reichenbachiella sp.]|uniref:hypothetical protein n=1 Tax=Reichenbachiella sp. TaxID=2184521 RepID=UPI003263174A